MGRKGVSKRKPQSKIKQLSKDKASIESAGGQGSISQLVKATDTGMAVASAARGQAKSSSDSKKKSKKR